MASDRYPMFKIVLLGEPGVGKSSIFFRAKDNSFQEGVRSTIGIDSCTRVIHTKTQKVKLCLWDTAGVERFRTLTRNYYRNTHAVLLVYSADDRATLDYLAKWAHDANDFAPSAAKFLIGNKIDIAQRIGDDTIHNFGMGHNCDSAFLISAKTGEGIEELMTSMGERLLKGNQETDLTSSWLEDVPVTKPEPKARCCS